MHLRSRKCLCICLGIIKQQGTAYAYTHTESALNENLDKEK